MDCLNLPNKTNYFCHNFDLFSVLTLKIKQYINLKKNKQDKNI